MIFQLLATLISAFLIAVTSSPVDSDPDDWRSQMLISLNAIRGKVGAPPMALSDVANSMANTHSDYQASINLMTHDSSEGSLGTRANALGIPWLGLAENVAAGDDLDPVGAIDLWLHSPHHYANMVGNYSLVGFGFAHSNTTRNVYWTQEFILV